jgi:hypothetical protein
MGTIALDASIAESFRNGTLSGAGTHIENKAFKRGVSGNMNLRGSDNSLRSLY